MSNHINAKKDQIAKTVFMAGDPLRVKYFVEKYFDEYEIVNTVRNETGYTGTINGKRISVLSHGMGLDSIGIYAYELFKEYDVENIIRFGSAGSYNSDFKILDLIVAEHAYTESNYGKGYGFEVDTLKASDKLLSLANEIKKQKFESNNNIKNTTVHSSMWFYTIDGLIDINKMAQKGVNVVEMEAYALYAIAKYFNKNALTLLTVSDSLVTNEALDHTDRETKFELMFQFIIEMMNHLG